MTCTCTPLYAVGVRESDVLLAMAFDEESIPVQWSSGPIHRPGCPLGPSAPPEPIQFLVPLP